MLKVFPNAASPRGTSRALAIRTREWQNETAIGLERAGLDYRMDEKKRSLSDP